MNLMPLYHTPGVIRRSIEELLRLPLLPASSIPAVFERLREKADTKLQELFHYVKTTWIESKQWSPSSWSVFKMAIRTNNDADGLHHKWNDDVKGKQSFYALTDQLEAIALDLPLSAELVKHGKLKQDKRAASIEKDQNLFEMWTLYEENNSNMTCLDLLNNLVSCQKLHVLTSEEDLCDNLDIDRYLFEQ